MILDVFLFFLSISHWKIETSFVVYICVSHLVTEIAFHVVHNTFIRREWLFSCSFLLFSLRMLSLLFIIFLMSWKDFSCSFILFSLRMTVTAFRGVNCIPYVHVYIYSKSHRIHYWHNNWHHRSFSPLAITDCLPLRFTWLSLANRYNDSVHYSI